MKKKLCDGCDKEVDFCTYCAEPLGEDLGTELICGNTVHFCDEDCLGHWLVERWLGVEGNFAEVVEEE